MIVFENIQKQAHDEDTIMRELAEQCAHDFAGVKILAIIILIYISFMVTLVSIPKKSNLRYLTIIQSFYST